MSLADLRAIVQTRVSSSWRSARVRAQADAGGDDRRARGVRRIYPSVTIDGLLATFVSVIARKPG